MFKQKKRLHRTMVTLSERRRIHRKRHHIEVVKRSNKANGIDLHLIYSNSSDV